MLQSLRNIWDIPDLRKRVLFTLGLLAVYRLGNHVPTPGINAKALIDFFEQNRSNWFGLVDMFSGGNLSRVTVDGSTKVNDYLRVTIDPSNPAVLSWTRVPFAS